MRLPEIDRGDGVFNRLLMGFISLASRMRLPDAARVAFYHKDFFGAPLGAWTHAAMRGPSRWSVGERELMAALVAKWNSCAFCLGAHGAVAAKEIERSAVDAALLDFRASPYLRKPEGDPGVSGDPDAAAHGTDRRGCKGRASCGRQRRSSDGCDRGWRPVQHCHTIRRCARLCGSNSKRVRSRRKHASQARV